MYVYLSMFASFSLSLWTFYVILFDVKRSLPPDATPRRHQIQKCALKKFRPAMAQGFRTLRCRVPRGEKRKLLTKPLRNES